MDLEKCRAAFEAHMRSAYNYDDRMLARDPSNGGEYALRMTRSEFVDWLAAVRWTAGECEKIASAEAVRTMSAGSTAVAVAIRAEFLGERSDG
jgi:hypothetical protein